MAVLTHSLSVSEVQKAEPDATYCEVFNGQGFTLFVRTTITLEYFPAMLLASARTLHAELLALLPKAITGCQPVVNHR